MKIKQSKNIKSWLSVLLFVFPFLSLFTVFFLYPFCQGVAFSFTDWNGISTTKTFVGLANYIDVFTKDDRFLNSLWVTTIYAVAVVIFSNVIALALALAIEKSGVLKVFFRTGYFFPYIFSLVVVGFSWKLLLTNGAKDFFELTGWEFFKLDFLGDSTLALISVIVMSIWQGLGYYLIIYIAGIQAVDKSILESAAIDGAYGAKRFFRVVLPLLMPSITVCVFTSIAGAFKAFDSVFVLTSGGPGYATETIALNIYNEAYGSANMFGYGMAKAVILALIILVITFLQLSFFKKHEVEM